MGERNDARSGTGWRIALVATLWVLSLGCATTPGGSPEGDGPRAPQPATEPAGSLATGPAEILDVELVEQGETASVRIDADRPLVWTNYRDREGRLILELSNTVAAADVSTRLAGQRLVERVDVERLDDAERPMTRFVVATRGDSELALDSEGSTLRLELTPVGYQEPVGLAAEPIESESVADEPVVAEPVPPISEPTVAVASADPAFSSPRTEVAGTPERPYVAAAPSGVAASRLLDVAVHERSSGTVVEISGDGEFAYSSFQLANPARFVIDLDGVVNTSRASTLPAHGDGVVEQVRVAQFKPRPDPVSRVVFDLESAVVPRIERSPDGLVVSFAPSAAGAAAVTVAASAPATAAPVTADLEPADDYTDDYTEDDFTDGDFAADDRDAAPQQLETAGSQVVAGTSAGSATTKCGWSEK